MRNKYEPVESICIKGRKIDEIFARWLLFWSKAKTKYLVWKDVPEKKVVAELHDLLLNRYKLQIPKSRKLKGDAEDKLTVKQRKKRRDNYYQAKLQELIDKIGLKEKAPVKYTARKALCKKLENRFAEITNGRQLSTITYNYSGYEGDYDWSFLWILANGKEFGDAEEISFLKYLYRYQRSGSVPAKKARQTIFPFITWDSGPDRSKFSFMWRLFNLESSQKGTSGHIFFIPF
ncbi:MAG: hypothetical protein GY750_09265 [Lentisphaerae bacterium]|nr:hypothetical protein [Lentisphaerota bacterium]MCP4101600.1 hypothetical protein [Lentisphaerota bacterium]